MDFKAAIQPETDTTNCCRPVEMLVSTALPPGSWATVTQGSCRYITIQLQEHPSNAGQERTATVSRLTDLLTELWRCKQIQLLHPWTHRHEGQNSAGAMWAEGNWALCREGKKAPLGTGKEQL